jgi:DNA polymerase-1
MKRRGEIVYLVDGSSYIHRAYHAIRHLSNSTGFPTNAVYGFTNMILKLLGEKGPKYVAIAFDAKGPNFRHDIYKAYKANRPPMPEDLVIQLPMIKSVVENLGLKMIEQPGYEADDVIGTLTRMAEEAGWDAIIVSGDKDFRQLISSRVSMWDTMKDKVIDFDTFSKNYGIEPEQVIDLMSLSGDSSDNIPGVQGVGEKTANILVKTYGSLENVYDHVEEITRKKLKENLKKAKNDAFMSKKLVTIERHVPLKETIRTLGVENPHYEALSDLFRKLEFKGLWERFSIREEPEKNEYELCLSEEALHSLIERIKKAGYVSVDTETTSKDALQAELVGISFSLEPNRAYYLPLAHHYLGAPEQLSLKKAVELLKPIFESEAIAKIGQNIKYDALVLSHHGMELKGFHFDTMVASYVINPGLRQHNLDYLSQHYLSHKMISYEEVVGKGKDQRSFSDVEVTRARDYSCEDADITFRLKHILEKQLRQNQNESLFYELEMPLIPVLMDMELTGIAIDAPFFKEMSRSFLAQLRDLERAIYQEAGMEFNINSPQQLGHVLFEKLQLPTQKKTTKTKAYSTDVKVLTKLAAMPYEIPKLLLRYRTLSKLKSTYLDALVQMMDPKTGRIHTSFNQTVTATGRLSSSNPNLQNIPIRGDEGREIRKGFVARKGWTLLSADYSQVELRVFAHMARDPVFLEAFRKGKDIHTRTASELMGVNDDEVNADMRRVAKAVNFGIIYGMGPHKLSEELGIDLETAKTYLSQYLEKYSGVAKYRKETISTAREQGFVTTLFNRRRYLPDLRHKNHSIRSEAERMAVNTPIQGTAADLIKKAMINIHGRLKREEARSKILLQVHDELLFEIPKEEIQIIPSIVKKEMEEVYTLAVPLKVDINTGKNWGEAH